MDIKRLLVQVLQCSMELSTLSRIHASMTIHAHMYACIHTYIHTYTCMHTYMHTYTCMHTYMHTYIHTNLDISARPIFPMLNGALHFVWIHASTTIHAHMYDPCIHTYIHVYMHTYIHKYIRTYLDISGLVHFVFRCIIELSTISRIHASTTIHAHMYVCIHTYMYTCIHTCIHTHIPRYQRSSRFSNA